MLTECEGCGDKTSQALTPCDECDRAVCEECSTGTSYCRSCYEDRLYCCEDCTRTPSWRGWYGESYEDD